MKFRNRIDNTPIIMYPRKAHVCRASTTQPYEHNRMRFASTYFDINGPNLNENHIFVIFQRNFEIESVTPPLLCALERLTYAVRQLHSHMSIIK